MYATIRVVYYLGNEVKVRGNPGCPWNVCYDSGVYYLGIQAKVNGNAKVDPYGFHGIPLISDGNPKGYPYSFH